jgi:hypothetical protein
MTLLSSFFNFLAAFVPSLSLGLRSYEITFTLQSAPIPRIAMEAVKRFFSSPRFAVAGASNDSNKFGYKSMARELHELRGNALF